MWIFSALWFNCYPHLDVSLLFIVITYAEAVIDSLFNDKVNIEAQIRDLWYSDA